MLVSVYGHDIERLTILERYLGLRPRKVKVKRHIQANRMRDILDEEGFVEFFLHISEYIPDHEIRLKALVSMIRKYSLSGDIAKVNALCGVIWPTLTTNRSLPYEFKITDWRDALSLLRYEKSHVCGQYLLNDYLVVLQEVVTQLETFDRNDGTIDSVKEEMLAVCHIIENTHEMHKVVLKFFTDVEVNANKGVTMTRATQIFHKSLVDLPATYLHGKGISQEKIRMYMRHLSQRRDVNINTEAKRYLESMIRSVGIAHLHLCSGETITELVLKENS